MVDKEQTIDDEFKLSVIDHITRLRSDINNVRASVENIKLTLKKHDHMFRDAASSLMSQREILLDFVDRKARYQEGGDCGLAAAEAWEVFDRSHKLMRPKLVDGVLYASSGDKAVMRKPATVPAQLVGIKH